MSKQLIPVQRVSKVCCRWHTTRGKSWISLFLLCTDGSPRTVGKNRIREKRRILSFPCLHQGALCAQMCGEQLGGVMSLVIRVVNFIVVRALKQFKTLLDEVGNHHPGLLLHSNMRWCSAVLQLVWAKSGPFLKWKMPSVPLAAPEWLLKLHYLVDMTEHLNQLNVKMQGIGNPIMSLQQCSHLKTS